VKISEALGAAKPLAVPIGDGTLNVTYVPADYTAVELEGIVAGESDTRVRAVVDLFVKHVKAWDLEFNDRDELIPLDPAVLRTDVPMHILAEVLKAVQKETSPNPEA
jgi:hypothetical protein